ncbi:MAG: flagellar hook assembly protein FlgD [Rhodospirillales bacterium]|nr:flagellar hook assembly protein FlgD [Rhodospirillales bacterium]
MATNTAAAAAAASSTTKTAGTTNTSSAVTKSDVSRNSLAKNLDTFLTLLTTQLKYQDPLSPMDSTQFTNQLVQFANVEQQINVNSNLEQMINLSKANQAVNSLNYIGSTVEVEGTTLPLQDGKATLTYELSKDVAMATVAISDEKGNLVHTEIGKIKAGEYTVEWDGKDDNGKQLADGKYKVDLTVLNLDEDVPATTSISVLGKVTGISSGADGEIILDCGDTSLSLNKVLQVTRKS